MHKEPLDKNFSQRYFEIVNQRSSGQIIIEYFDPVNKLSEISFGEFHSLVLSNLDKLKSVKEDTILLPGRNDPQYLASIVSILLSGKKAFPINPDYHSDFIKDVIERAGLDLAIWNDEGIRSFISLKDGRNNKKLDDFIYILTSGTTGQFKIVRQREDSVLLNLDALIEHHQLNNGKKILTPLPCFHVNALEFSFFCSLFTAKGTLVLLESAHPHLLLDAIEKTKPDIISIEPTILQSLNLWVEAKKISRNLSSTYIVSAASALSRDVYLRAKKNFNTKIIQGYGLSEAVNFSVLMPINLEEEDIDHLMEEYPQTSIGSALNGNLLEIMDDKNNKLAEKEIGNIVISGDLLMNGYIGQPAIDRSFFFTGDLGFYIIGPQRKKFYFITGRKKEIIKRNSVTIPLVDIDNLFKEFLLDGEDAITVPFNSDFRGEDFAIIFLEKMSLIRIKKIQKSLNNKMPDQYKPSLYMRSSNRLRTPSGKPLRLFFRDILAEYGKRIFPKNGIVDENILIVE